MFSPPLPMYLGIQECIKTRSIPNFFFNWGDGIVPYRLCGAKQQPSFSLTLSISQEKYNVSMLYWIIYLSLQLVVGIAGEKPNTTYQEKKKTNQKPEKVNKNPNANQKNPQTLLWRLKIRVVFFAEHSPPHPPTCFCFRLSALSSFSRKILTLTKLQASASVNTKKALREDEKLIIKDSVSWQ